MLPSGRRSTEQMWPPGRLVSGGVRLNNVALAQNGDREAFEELVREFTPAIYRVARAIVGESSAPDVVQDVFMSAWRELPKLREPQRFPAWLHRIAVNRGRSTLRSHSRVREVDIASTENALPAADFRPDVEARAVLMPVLLALPFDQRSVVALHYAGGLTLAETAQILEIPDGTVKSRLNAALASLRRALTEVSDG
jgi:RNA polymerase sigma-70 factor (ECF subfamily)